MESHQDVERLLPVTSLRGWLIAAAGALLVIAAVLLAAATTQPMVVSGEGRTVDGMGVALTVASVSGQIADLEVRPGQKVQDNSVVAHVRSGERLVPQYTDVSGVVIGSLLRPGDPVAEGDWILEIAPQESDGYRVLVTFPAPVGDQLAAGQPATVTLVGARAVNEVGRTITGRVEEVTPPLRPRDLELGLAMLDPPAEDQVVAAIRLDDHLEPGSWVEAEVTVGEHNLLREMLGLS